MKKRSNTFSDWSKLLLIISLGMAIISTIDKDIVMIGVSLIVFMIGILMYVIKLDLLIEKRWPQQKNR